MCKTQFTRGFLEFEETLFSKRKGVVKRNSWQLSSIDTECLPTNTSFVRILRKAAPFLSRKPRVGQEARDSQNDLKPCSNPM